MIHFSLGLKSDASGSGPKAFGDDLAHHPSDSSVAKGAQRRHATTGKSNGHCLCNTRTAFVMTALLSIGLLPGI